MTSMTSILISLELIPVTTDHDDPLVVQCASCHGSLVLHQPDEELPERMLGTCEECQTWFLIYADTQLMLKLPDEKMLRDPRERWSPSLDPTRSAPHRP